MSSTGDANGTRTPAVETCVVGSLPRPRWLFDVMEQQRSGTLSIAEAESCMDDVVQLDDPVQRFLKEAAAGLGEGHIGPEIDLSVQTINAAVEGVSGLEIGLHLCSSHAFYAPSAPGHDAFLRALDAVQVHRITLEFAEAGADHLDVLGEFPADKRLGYGAIARANDDAETVTVVVERIERALGFLPPERLTVNPDCGLAPTAQRTPGSTLDDAYDRLSMLCAAARAVRET